MRRRAGASTGSTAIRHATLRVGRAAARAPAGLGAAVAAIAATAPARAWALCPNCLGQTRALTPKLELLGGFLLVPFLVFYVAVRAIRRACRSPSAPDPS
jgi:hypothetical protein